MYVCIHVCIIIIIIIIIIIEANGTPHTNVLFLQGLPIICLGLHVVFCTSHNHIGLQGLLRG
jgi:hypothetical protein